MIERSVAAGTHTIVRVRCSARSDGDFHPDSAGGELALRRQALAPGAWTWLRQVHGTRVVAVEEPGEHAGTEADGSVTSTSNAILAVQTADCAPIVIAAPGVVAVAHAGWRGLVDGVVAEAVDAVRARSSGPVHALLGPCIGPDGYEFGAEDLDAVVAVVGESARGRTADGALALDLPAAVKAALGQSGIDSFEDVGLDTAQPSWFSHRVRNDPERQVTVAWLEQCS